MDHSLFKLLHRDNSPNSLSKPAARYGTSSAITQVDRSDGDGRSFQGSGNLDYKREARQGSRSNGHLRLDEQFIGLLNIYREYGGLLMGDELISYMDLDRKLGLAMVARKMVAGEFIFFTWAHTLWVPAFQIDRRHHCIADGPRRVALELNKVLDGWELAGWFCKPNAWLNGRMPLELMDVELEDVVDAARADRFIALG